jgi:hypothetical protein
MNQKARSHSILQNVKRMHKRMSKYCFGVLRAKFQIIANPNRQWSKEVIVDVLMACVVLCNMNIENEEGYTLPQKKITFEVFRNGTNAIKDVDALNLEMTSLNTRGH